MTRFGLIGPTYPYRGGIAHYTTLLAKQLQDEHDLLLISFSRQYPRWMFAGRSDRDPSFRPIQVGAEYLLDPLNPLSWRRTLHRLDQWGAEIVVVPWWVPYWAPAWAALGRGIKRLPGHPRLLFICHNVLPHERTALDRIALRLALAPGDGFLVHSQSDAETLKDQLRQPNVRVTALPTFASLGKVGEVDLPRAVPEDRPLLLFFGFVRPYKGLDILIRALPSIQKPYHLLVVGEFWEDEERYHKLIASLGLHDAVTIINEYVPNEQLTAYVSSASVVVLPYRSATQSAAIQLAFGLGRPVITTDVGGLSEAVDDGRTGLLVPPENPDALATAIDRFLDHNLGPEFEVNIRQASQRFSWQRLVEQLLSLAALTETDG